MNISNFESFYTLYSDNPMIFQAMDLRDINAEMQNELQSYNIYIIARSNRVWLLPESVKLDIESNEVSFDIVVQNGYRSKLQEIRSVLPPGSESH
jgi:hypothetical protein